MRTRTAPIRVAIIDTGIEAGARTDGWLAEVRGGSLTAAAGAVRDNPRQHIDPLYQLPDSTRLGYGSGHGTFVAGVVAQVAPDAHLTMYRALRGDGLGDEVEVARALVKAAEDGADIINLSFGFQSFQDEPPLALGLALGRIREVQRREQREVVVVAAAGNYGDERPTWPAAFPDVVAVSAVDGDLAPAEWSSRGPWVDVATIGQGVLSTYVPGTSFDESGHLLEEFDDNSFARWSGTSFAAPQIAGAVAAEATASGVSVKEALRLVLARARPTPWQGTPVLVVLPPR